MRQEKPDVPQSSTHNYRDHVRKILSISAEPGDHDSLRGLLRDSDWRITAAFSCQQAMACLCRQRVDIIICDCLLPDGNWQDILSQIAALPEPSAVIVTSISPDACLRADVRAMGGNEVLSKPFVPEEVSRVVVAAWENRAVAIAESAPV